MTDDTQVLPSEDPTQELTALRVMREKGVAPPPHPQTSLWDVFHGWTTSLLAGLSTVLLVAAAAVYFIRPVELAVLTMYPAWIWALSGIALTILSHRRGRRWRTLLLLVGWAVYLGVFAEEVKAVVTFHKPWPTQEWLAAKDEGRGIRIVTANCASRRRAAAEALAHEPDVLLIQESPQPETLEELVAEAAEGYEVLSSRLTAPAIVVRGTLSRRALPDDYARWAVAADAQVDGRDLVLMSVHFAVPYRGWDFWHKTARAEEWASFTRRKEQMELVAEWIDGVDESKPLIVAGDFNTPSGDRLFRSMSERVHDAYPEGGIGWGHTKGNNRAIFRIDQIWLDDHLRANGVVARKTVSSDHRFVIGDVIFEE